MPRKIAFIKAGSFSNLNERIAQMLRQQFPEREIDVIDIYDLIKKDKRLALINVISTIREYGFKALTSKKKFLRHFLLTTYLFNQIKALITDYVSPKSHAFSFQTQSFFDASVTGVPHFVYTDDTLLVHLYARNASKGDRLSKSRVSLEKTVYQNACINFTLGSQVRRSIIEQYACSPEKTICIGAGGNLRTDQSGSSYQRRNKNILFVGVDWERKGGPELVEAFKLVLKQHPDAHLTIVGCSPNVDIANCQVIGRIPVEAVNQYYKNAYVFCLPTKREPFGIALIEAFGYGLPVVSSNVGGLADYIQDGENGHVIQPGNVQQIADALIDLLGSPEKAAEFGKNGYHLVVERLSWEKIGINLKQAIEPFIHRKIVYLERHHTSQFYKNTRKCHFGKTLRDT